MLHKIRPEIAGYAADISTITPHPRNARRGNVEDIAESLQIHGQYKPIIVQQQTGHIVAGNHTYQAAKTLQWTHIAAVFLDLTDDQALRLLLIDNRSSDVATYDEHELAVLLREMQKSVIGLDGTGFEDEDLDKLLDKLAEDAANAGEDDDDALPPGPDQSAIRECPQCQYRWRTGPDGEPLDA